MPSQLATQTDRFAAVSPVGSLVILEKTTFIEVDTPDGSQRKEEIKHYETTHGEVLNVTGPGTFQSAWSGMCYQRV